MKTLFKLIISTIMACLVLPASARAAEKETIFIQTPKVAGIEAAEAEGYSALIARETDSYGLFQTSTFDDLTAMLDLDQQKELLGCDDNSCMIEIRNAIGARYVIKSNITKNDGGYMVSLAFIDSEDFKILARSSVTGVGNAALAITNSSRELLNQAVTILFPEQAAEIVRQHPLTPIDDKPHSGNGLKSGAISLGVIGGALLITGGIMGGLAQKSKKEALRMADDPSVTDVNDIKQIYSKNRALGTTSYIMYGVGGGLAVTSVIMGVIYAKKDKKTAVSLVPEFSRQQLMLSLSGNF